MKLMAKQQIISWIWEDHFVEHARWMDAMHSRRWWIGSTSGVLALYPFRGTNPHPGLSVWSTCCQKPLSLQIVHLVFPYIPSSTPFCLLRTSVQLGSDQPWVSSLNWVRNKEGHAGSQTPTINNLLPQSSQATASYHCVPSSHLQSCPFEKIWPNNVRLPQDNVRFNLLLFNMPRSKVR